MSWCQTATCVAVSLGFCRADAETVLKLCGGHGREALVLAQHSVVIPESVDSADIGAGAASEPDGGPPLDTIKCALLLT